MILSSFNSNFKAISKPNISIDCADNLKKIIDTAVFILNRYYFISKAVIADKIKNIIFEINRESLKTFLDFYKGKGV